MTIATNLGTFSERYRGRDEYENEYMSGKPKREHRKDRPGHLSERGENNYASDYYGAPSFNIDIYKNAYMDFFQNRQFYHDLRLTDPHRYAEWYKRFQYYERYLAGQMAANSTANANVTTNLARESGRESVHSGRSSAKEADR